MSLLAAIFAQLLHGALILALAPLAAGSLASADAVLAGRAPPLPWQPWRDLRRLARKQSAQADSAAGWSAVLLPACCAAMATAAFLVPSFTLGMGLAPAADLLAIAGLATLSRLALILAALDPGTAAPGIAAARAASLGCLAEPVMFLAILALGLLGGTTNLDLLIGLQLQGMLQPIAAVALVAAALVLLALAVPGTTALTTEFSGGDLALAELAEAFRLLLWLDLLGALFLPLGIAGPDAGLVGWTIGLLAWAVKLVMLLALLAGLRRLTGALVPGDQTHMGPKRLVQAAAALSLLAALLVLAGTVAA